MLFLEYPKCSTCKKAKKFLDDRRIKYIDRNIKEDNPNIRELNQWIKLSNKDINKFFNTSGIKYRELKLKVRLKTMSYNEKLDLLSSDGMLIKRPLLITSDRVFIGFKEVDWDMIKNE